MKRQMLGIGICIIVIGIAGFLWQQSRARAQSPAPTPPTVSASPALAPAAPLNPPALSAALPQAPKTTGQVPSKELLRMEEIEKQLVVQQEVAEQAVIECGKKDKRLQDFNALLEERKSLIGKVADTNHLSIKCFHSLMTNQNKQRCLSEKKVWLIDEDGGIRMVP